MLAAATTVGPPCEKREARQANDRFPRDGVLSLSLGRCRLAVLNCRATRCRAELARSTTATRGYVIFQFVYHMCIQIHRSLSLSLYIYIYMCIYIYIYIYMYMRIYNIHIQHDQVLFCAQTITSITSCGCANIPAM